jgi:hypothetical protein
MTNVRLSLVAPLAAIVVLVLLASLGTAPSSRAAALPAVAPAVPVAGEPDFGPNVYVFDPSMPQVHSAVLRERRVHRRFPLRRRDHHQRVPAAILRPQHRAGRLV